MILNGPAKMCINIIVGIYRITYLYYSTLTMNHDYRIIMFQILVIARVKFVGFY